MFICSELTSNTQFELTENLFLKTNGIYSNFPTLSFSRSTVISREMRNKKL